MKTQDLLDNIKNGKYELLEFIKDENDYGEWIFVTVKSNETRQTLGFYSNFGFHYKKERYLLDNSFHQYTTNEWRSGKPHPSVQELEDCINKYYAEIKEKYQQQEPEDDYQKKRNGIYDLLTELGDEDGTISEMEDMGML